ncbi:hypothetical protein POJ06DRAFT_247661, partial [Lipomyces tetrasporus]
MGSASYSMQLDLPGYMDTPLNTIFEEKYFHEWKAQTPMGRLGQTDELAACALWHPMQALTVLAVTFLLMLVILFC